MALHHSIVKKATRLGFEFIVLERGFQLKEISSGILSQDEYDTTAEAFEAFENGDVEWAVDEEEDEEGEGKGGSVVKRPYHVAYSKNPHGPGCGDGLDVAMRDAVMVHVEGSKGQHVDLAILKEIGLTNNLWSSSWETLNPGMQRMNLTNRLRAYLRNGEERLIDLHASGMGRFGVQFKPAKGKAKKSAVAVAKKQDGKEAA